MLAVWLGLLVALPAVGALLAWLRPGRQYSLRAFPADVFRLVVLVGVAVWIEPALGILAALGGAWWLVHGWPRLPGGLLWPMIAVGLFLVGQAPAWAHDAALAGLLTMGVAQTVAAVAQSRGVPFFPGPARSGLAHGTFGNRTGLALYLAFVTPLAHLLEPVTAWILTIAFGFGIVVSRSSVGAIAYGAGLVWVAPEAIVPIVVLSLIAFAFGCLKRAPDRWYGVKFRHVSDSLRARGRIWRIALGYTLAWPAWLVGHGPETFKQTAIPWLTEGLWGEAPAEAHNDYVEFFFEYGTVGLLAVAWFLWRYQQAWVFGDPLVGVLVALSVGMLANFPVRVATVATVPLLVLGMLMARVSVVASVAVDLLVVLTVVVALGVVIWRLYQADEMHFREVAQARDPILAIRESLRWPLFGPRQDLQIILRHYDNGALGFQISGIERPVSESEAIRLLVMLAQKLRHAQANRDAGGPTPLYPQEAPAWLSQLSKT